MSILLIISIISMRRLIIFHASIIILDLFPREFLCLEYPQHFRFSNRQLNLINCLPIFDSPLGCSQEYFPRVGSAPVWAKKKPKTIHFTDPWGGGEAPYPWIRLWSPALKNYTLFNISPVRARIFFSICKDVKKEFVLVGNTLEQIASFSLIYCFYKIMFWYF